MLRVRGTDDSAASIRASAFWWRVSDNLMRRFVWFLLPVIALTAVGVLQASKAEELYRSRATLSASSNPLVPDQPLGAAVPGFRETAAQATSRIINERMRTDSFTKAVAGAAGLGDAVDAGFVGLEALRRSVWAADDGETILTINAVWSDPVTAQQLVSATIAQYQEYINETVASASSEAETFYETRLAEVMIERDEALTALEEYVADLPPVEDEEDRPIRVQLELARLTDALDTAETRVEATQENIENAQLLRAQQMTVAGRSYVVIDEPNTPGAPQTTLVQQLTTVLSFAVMGLIVAAAAVVVTSLLDTTVASPFDLLAQSDIAVVATVPNVKLPDSPTRATRSRSRTRRKRRSSTA